MLITFIDPPNLLKKSNVERVFGCTYSLYPFPNIFSLSNASVLEKEGFRARYIDMANEGWNLNRLKAFLRNDNSSVYAFHSVNLSIKPDLEVYKEIRAIKNDAFLIFSGPAPTYFPELFLKDEKAFAVRGETELTIPELVRSLSDNGDLGKINGLSYLSGSTIKDNPARPLIDNLDKLPFPARDLLKKNIYYNPKLPRRPFTALETSRNCSYRCLFCVPNSANFACELEYRKHNHNLKPPVRSKSAEKVIAEFKRLAALGYKSVSIIDDQFLWSRERTIKICNGIKDLKLDWGCLARADHLDEEIVKSLAKSGCRYVDIGVESFNQGVLDYLKKDLKVDQIYRAVDLLKRHKILAKINLILGSSPAQGKEDIENDINQAMQLKVDAVMFSIATPFPGTEFYRMAEENQWFSKGNYRAESVQRESIISYPDLSDRELNRIIRKANLRFYFSLHFIKNNLKRIFSPRNFYFALRALKRKFY